MTHGFADTPLPAGGAHGFVGDYAQGARLDPVNERQTVTTGTADAMAKTAGPAETIGEHDFEGPRPEDLPRKGGSLAIAIETALFPKGRVLVSYENPDGFKLEELCDQLTRELLLKSEKLSSAVLDTTPKGAAARTAVEHNGVIIGLLQTIKSTQLATMAAFAAVAPDQGPTAGPLGRFALEPGVSVISRDNYLCDDGEASETALRQLTEMTRSGGGRTRLILDPGQHNVQSYELALADEVHLHKPDGSIEVLKGGWSARGFAAHA